MSHKATTWLSEIPADRLGASEFRVLFHLCDCHNPSAGCFPTQAYLIERAGVSNGTLNNALKAMEVKGLIKRHQTRNGVTKRQNPTRYILGFETVDTQEPTPKSGDGKRGKPSPKTGDGADSKKRGEPSPISGGGPSPAHWRVTCKEPVNNRACEREAMFFTSDEVGEAQQIARHVKAGKPVRAEGIAERIKTCLVAHKLLTDHDLKTLGIC
uniref:helix-turn-helix domain-containing protein n=1 Tax=Roseovarius sp. BRH_c41 TaxID=1629709 RepID=UPI000A9ED9E3|nr:helix-turn-helix domain-containing protein [Roseovarius sp. BRH_c41]